MCIRDRSKGVRARMAELADTFPAGVKYNVCLLYTSTLRVSGTCFASTTIFKLIYFNIFGISNIPTANLLKQFERQKDMGRKYAQKGEVLSLIHI